MGESNPHVYAKQWPPCPICSINEEPHGLEFCVVRLQKRLERKNLILEELIDFVAMWIRTGCMDGPNFLECLEHGKEEVGYGVRLRASRAMSSVSGASADQERKQILKIRK